MIKKLLLEDAVKIAATTGIIMAISFSLIVMLVLTLFAPDNQSKQPVAVAPPAPQPIPDPIPNSPQFVDFDDLTGLERETQAMLEERRRQDRSDQKRLERIEWNIRILNQRMFGASVIIPAGTSPHGELGQELGSTNDELDFEPESEAEFGDGPQPETEQ